MWITVAHGFLPSRGKKKQESSWVAYCGREGKTTIMTRERFEMQKIGRGSRERGGGSVKHVYGGVLVLTIIA